METSPQAHVKRIKNSCAFRLFFSQQSDYHNTRGHGKLLAAKLHPGLVYHVHTVRAKRAQLVSHTPWLDTHSVHRVWQRGLELPSLFRQVPRKNHRQTPRSQSPAPPPSCLQHLDDCFAILLTNIFGQQAPRRPQQ